MKPSAPTVVLVGLMGTGKSTVAWELSRHYRIPLLDTDKIVEQVAGKSVREIFAEEGEPAFRALESDVLVQCLHQPDGAVVAGAGGVVLEERNRDAINASRRDGTVVVWLTATTDVLADRTAKGAHRPLLDDDRRGVLAEMARVREPLYREIADVIVDVSDRSVESVAELVVQSIEAMRSMAGGEETR